MRALTGLLAILALGACEPPEKEPAPEVPVRAIKYMTIGSVADEDERILAGVVEAGTSSNVAFEIGGRVLEMTARVGETIETGQYLARLDPEPYELQVQQAEYTLRQATASEEDARAKYAQQSRLWQNRYTTKTALDTALSNLRNAEGQIGIARSQLDLRKRDLQKTRLLAPFGGRVAEREVEVFEEVTAGQAIYALQTEGEDEVSVSVPEKLVPKMRVGQRVSVSFPPLDGAQATGIMTEISPRAGDGNAYPAKLRLDTVPPGLRAGMSAEITVSFATEQTGSAFTVPIGALKGSPSGASQAVIYVYDAEAGVVRERAVKVVGMEGNTPQIVGNLQPGEIIATAGVGYMFDGMEVRLLDPSNPF